MKRIIIPFFIALLLGVGLLVYFGQRETQQKELYYSGTIEATQAQLAFLVSGRVTHVLADEGESVEKGQILAELDSAELQARHEQALANLEGAKRNLRRLELAFEIREQTMPLEVERARAGVQALQSQLNELESGYREQDVEQARLALLAMKATMEEARKDKERSERLLNQGIVSAKESDVAALRYETAAKEYESAEERLKLVKEGFRKETIQTARARLEEGKAFLRQARSNLKQIEAAQRDVEAAKAQVMVAEASVRLADTQLQYARLKAPFSGIITNRNLEPGEVVLPARTVLSLSDLSSVDLKIFIDETEIGKVKPGQKVEVRVDTFPRKVYWGKVSYISPEGEFTPKIIQTQKERVKLVYMVKVSIKNPDLELKSGMPADAWLR